MKRLIRLSLANLTLLNDLTKRNCKLTRLHFDCMKMSQIILIHVDRQPEVGRELSRVKERDANFKTYKMLFVKAKFAPLVLIKTGLEGALGVSLLKTCGIKFSNICHLSKIHQGFIFTKAIRFHWKHLSRFFE